MAIKLIFNCVYFIFRVTSRSCEWLRIIRNGSKGVTRGENTDEGGCQHGMRSDFTPYNYTKYW